MNQRVDPDAENGASETVVLVPSDAVIAPKPKRNNSRRLMLMFGLPVVLVIGGSYFYLTGGRYEGTDNAYVRQTIVSLSSDVAGRIVEVDVGENQHVSGGQVLFRLDAEPYRIAVEQAEAALANARIAVDQLRVSYRTALAKLETARNALDIKQRARDRLVNLTSKGISTAAANDTSLLDLEAARSGVDLAQQAVDSAVAALGGNPDIATDDHPAVEAALAAVDAAQRNLDKTTVLAPAAGIISQVGSLNVGQLITTGATIATLVETGAELGRGQFQGNPARTHTAGPGRRDRSRCLSGTKLHGTIASIGAATGAEFALIPAQNATGNWVKVMQRVPVRIAIDAADGIDLRAGMSAAVSVDTGKTLLDRLI